jgi:hypothetical protein
MKYMYLVCTLFSLNAFASNNLACESIENNGLTYSVDQIGTTDRYELVVRVKSGHTADRVIYRERLTHQDWQGVSEYAGRLTTLVDGEDNEGYVSLTHSGSYLKSTYLNCRRNP